MKNRETDLYLEHISLLQYKNYQQQHFTFHNKVVAITGPNGKGKTNLLDAIYYLCFTRSYFSSQESQNILFGTNGFRLEGLLQRNGLPEKITCIVRDGKKEFMLNESAYTKLSQHIGQFPAVMIAPDDAMTITGSSEERRKFTDTLLCQLYPSYLENLIAYNKLLQQRNSLLKNTASLQALNTTLLDTFDDQLAVYGKAIFQTRRDFLQGFVTRVQEFYDLIAGSHETVAVHYRSELLHHDFRQMLAEQRQKDLLLQRTSCGIHRDDLFFMLGSHPLKTSGSQGQRKSFLFALKLAQYSSLRDHKGVCPFLLLDDLFEKLDQQRSQRLISLVCQPGFGQVFITDTHAERVSAAFAGKPAEPQMISL